jgi:hypothetical protein
MPQPLSRVARMLEQRGYAYHSRREYSDRRNAFFYVFAHPTLPRVGFAVKREQVSMRAYYRIKSLLEGIGDEPNEKEE